jgi:hypothetical protein
MNVIPSGVTNLVCNLFVAQHGEMGPEFCLRGQPIYSWNRQREEHECNYENKTEKWYVSYCLCLSPAAYIRYLYHKTGHPNKQDPNHARPWKYPNKHHQTMVILFLIQWFLPYLSVTPPLISGLPPGLSHAWWEPMPICLPRTQRATPPLPMLDQDPGFKGRLSPSHNLPDLRRSNIITYDHAQSYSAHRPPITSVFSKIAPVLFPAYRNQFLSTFVTPTWSIMTMQPNLGANTYLYLSEDQDQPLSS